MRVGDKMSERPQDTTVRIAQMTRDLLYLAKKATKRGFATETEKRQIAILRRNIASLKSGGDFVYEPDGGDS